jgi:hypothetical protein
MTQRTDTKKQAPKIKGVKHYSRKTPTHSYVGRDGQAFYRHAGGYHEIRGDFPVGLLSKKEFDKFTKGKEPVADMGNNQRNLGASKNKTSASKTLKAVMKEVNW